MDHLSRSQIDGAAKLFIDFLKNEESGGKPPSLREFIHALRESAFAAFTAGALLSTTLTNIADASEARTATRQERVEVDVLTEHEIDFLAQNVYHEARGESLKGQLAVAQVTLGRLASAKFDKKGKGLIDGIIMAPYQFSWTRDPRILMSKVDTKLLADIRAILSLYAGRKSVHEAVRQLAQETGLPLNTHFYKRTDLKKYDSKETEELFELRLTPVGEIDKHTYYIHVPQTAPRRTARAEKTR